MAGSFIAVSFSFAFLCGTYKGLLLSLPLLDLCFPHVPTPLLCLVSQVSDIQNLDEASLSHALEMASGKRLQKLMSKTMQSAFAVDALDWIGCTGCDDDAREVLEFHSELLLSHIGYMHQTQMHYRSWPWKMVLCLQRGFLPEVLDEMKSMWEFITNEIDISQPKSQIYKVCCWTRAQCFREAFIAAE